VTFRNCTNKGDYKGFTRSESTTLVIDITKDLEVIWKNMHVNVRNKINRAMRQNIIIKRNQNYDDFDKIQRSFREKKGIETAENIEILKKYGTLFVAEIEGDVLAGIFYLEDNNVIRGWYGATKRLEVDKEKQKVISTANRLIDWEAIKYAKAKGIKVYDNGGYYTGKKKDPQKEKINQYKRGLGGKLVTNYIYEKDYSIRYKIAKKIYNLKQEVLK
jgi:lipid II:glycine glycyltransferase (peptidoglycan interpeptide bridge formation enzyme)